MSKKDILLRLFFDVFFELQGLVAYCEMVLMQNDWRTTFCPEIIGESKSLEDVIGKAKRVAPTDCTVIINGETGTGKELLASAIHRASPRSRKPFVAVNCAAMSKDLLESEMFGHVQGAFTTAIRNREGRFQVADGGTIFLDEIGEMPLALQGKLLRVLQSGEFSAVGESRVRRVDVRVLAATNANLVNMVREGTFRQDLYYRLNVVCLCLPSLCDRGDDIDALVEHFIHKASSRYNREIPTISKAANHRLRTHTWPGNIRELENAVEHAVLMSTGTVLEDEDLPTLECMTSGDLTDFIRPITDDGIDLQLTLRQIEAHYINQALHQTAGNKNQAASLLSLNRTTLVEKLKRGLVEPTRIAV